MVKTGRNEGDIVTDVLSQGGFGVSLFFVISGLIISLPFAKAYLGGGARPTLADYYLRRLTRLEPPYFVNLVIMFGLLSVLKADAVVDRLPHLLASAFYQHNLVYGAVSSVNFVAWSLEVEFQFYALAPLLVRVFGVRSQPRRRGIIAAAILLASALALAAESSPGMRLSIIGHGGYFLAGFLLAECLLRVRVVVGLSSEGVDRRASSPGPAFSRSSSTEACCAPSSHCWWRPLMLPPSAARGHGRCSDNRRSTSWEGCATRSTSTILRSSRRWGIPCCGSCREASRYRLRWRRWRLPSYRSCSS